jgi:hypothetical protein
MESVDDLIRDFSERHDRSLKNKWEGVDWIQLD